MNEQLMEKFLDYQYQNDFKSFKYNFLNYMFVISKDKRNEFQHSLIKMKNCPIPQKHFKENSMKTVFEELLKEIYTKQIFTMEEFDELKNSEKYYVDFLKLIFTKDFKEHFKDKDKDKEELLYYIYQYMFIIFFCLEMSEGKLADKYLYLNYFFETYSKKNDLIHKTIIFKRRTLYFKYK